MGLPQDLTLAFRTLPRNGAFTAVAVLALALGIGVNTAIFSVVNAVLLRALPYQDAGRLAMVWSPNTDFATSFGDALPPSNGDFNDWRARNRVFNSLAAFTSAHYNLSGSGQPDQAAGVRVTADFFRTFQVSPVAGRALSEEDDQPGKRHVVISETLWRNRLAADGRATHKV
jgi:hypothetical protein